MRGIGKRIAVLGLMCTFLNSTLLTSNALALQANNKNLEVNESLTPKQYVEKNSAQNEDKNKVNLQESLWNIFDTNIDGYSKSRKQNNKLAKNSEELISDTYLAKDSSTKPGDDFYQYANGTWISQAMSDIKSDTDMRGTYSDIETNNEEKIKKEFYKILDNRSQYSSDSEEKKMLNFYDNIMNSTERDKDGIEPIKKYIDMVESVNSLGDLVNVLSNQDIDVVNNIYVMSVKQSNDNTIYEPYIGPTDIGLGSAEAYTSKSDVGQALRAQYSKFLNNLLNEAGYDETTSADKVDKVMRFESEISKSITEDDILTDSNIDKSKYYVEVSLSQLKSIAPNIDFETIFNNLGIDKTCRIKIQDMTWLKKLNEMWTQDNLDLLKNYLEVGIIKATGKYLTTSMNEEYYKYVDNILGKDMRYSSLEDEAYSRTSDLFDMCLGKYYMKDYFSEAEKDDVTEIANEVMTAYKNRIQNCDWICDKTKQGILDKFNKMSINIGYSCGGKDYSKVDIKSYADGGSYAENVFNMASSTKKHNYKVVNIPIEKCISDVSIAPQESKAEYHFFSNAIIITPGILQPDLYDINYSKEQKMATVGMVIAHEIGHSLDEYGAVFNGNGDIAYWWGENDFTKFMKKTDHVVEYFNKVEALPGKYVNGKSTLSENLADLNGMTCVLDVLKTKDNVDYKAFFEKYADMYKSAMTPKAEEVLLGYDTHSPDKVRVNSIVSQFDEFYTAYGISPSDKMYIKPENRLKVW